MLTRPDFPDRHARHRARAKAGVAVAQVEFDGQILSWLIKLGWLLESEAGDRCAVGRAIGAMVADSARR